MIMSTLSQIAEILKEYSHHEDALHVDNTPLLKRISSKMEHNKELIFLLPAFPAKSPSPDKTSGELPDFGEVLALQNLQKLCDKLSALYIPGARVLICSDGRIFGDVVKVTDEGIDNYQKGIIEIIKDFGLNRLSTFSMDDLFPNLVASEQRTTLLERFAKDVEEVRELVKTSETYGRLFNGMHRFLMEDELALNKTETKNQVSKQTKIRTYELIRRSDAWSALLNHHFKDELRLSIHPYQLNHEKFGIKLVASSSNWATPWHNVVVKIKDNFELMHRKEAMKLNAIPKMMKDKYAYFELANV
jgi:pyoverdine/dityrosine biosynthesis protein Dit1